MALGTLFCTVAGYFAMPQMMQAAKAGDGLLPGFGQLHAFSAAPFALKWVMVLVLAWRAAGSVNRPPFS